MIAPNSTLPRPRSAILLVTCLSVTVAAGACATSPAVSQQTTPEATNGGSEPALPPPAPEGSLNSPVRSQDPSVFTNPDVLDHLAKIVWKSDESLAYTKPASTIAPAQTAFAQQMPPMIQEIRPGKLYHASGFQLASTLIAVGRGGLIIIDPGSDDDSAKSVKEAFAKVDPEAAKLPVRAVVYSHRHPDHAFGSAGWGVTQKDVDRGTAKIIASENLVNNLINDVGVVGNILTQRTAYTAGYVKQGPEGPVHFAIGPAFGAGPISFFLPTVEVREEKPLILNVAGVKMELFHAYGDAGTDEIDVYFPQYEHVHGSETVQGETFPNLYTMRGTSYRDVKAWYEGVGKLLAYAKKANTYSGSHMRAWVGTEFIVERIQSYRDAVQYVHDQTIYWINLGYKRDQLAEKVVLPEPYASDPWLMEYYGTVAHSVRNIYDGYLGWWDGDVTLLARPGFIELSRQYVNAMGGRDQVVALAKRAVDRRNYGWAAEILTHVTRVDPTDMEARGLKAEALRQWAFMQTNIYWRAYGISDAKELDGTLDRSQPWDFSDPAIVKVLPTVKILETMSVRLNAKRAEGAQVKIGFLVTDTNEAAGYEVRHRIAAFSASKPDDADATLKGSKAAILETVATGQISDSVQVEGDRDKAEAFLALFDVIKPNGVNLVLPPEAPVKPGGN